MFGTVKKLVAAGLAATTLASASMPASAFDASWWAQEQAFSSQFDAWAQGSMQNMLAQCAAARAAGLLNGACFGNYDPSILSDSNTGGDAITSGWWNQQNSQSQALGGFSEGMRGSAAFTDQWGNVYYGDPSAASTWVNNYGQVQGMNGFDPPDWQNSWTQIFPMGQ